MIRILALIAILALTLVARDVPKIKQVPPSATSPASGQEMFDAYCATCHGKDAKGTGIAATILNKQPTDLTRLTADNQGKFPALRVYNSIVGDNMNLAHNIKDMPIWGNVFRSMTRGEGEIQMRIHNLTKYVESLQVK